MMLLACSRQLNPRRMGPPGLILTAIACLAFIASCAGTPELPRDATTGPAIYAHLCQKCHGADGWGDGPQAQWQYLPPANFHKPSSMLKSDDQLLTIIEHGIIFSPMHSFRDVLNHTQMHDVLAYIRVLSQRRR